MMHRSPRTLPYPICVLVSPAQQYNCSGLLGIGVALSLTRAGRRCRTPGPRRGALRHLCHLLQRQRLARCLAAA